MQESQCDSNEVRKGSLNGAHLIVANYNIVLLRNIKASLVMIKTDLEALNIWIDSEKKSNRSFEPISSWLKENGCPCSF